MNIKALLALLPAFMFTVSCCARPRVMSTAEQNDDSVIVDTTGLDLYAATADSLSASRLVDFYIASSRDLHELLDEAESTLFTPGTPTYGEARLRSLLIAISAAEIDDETVGERVNYLLENIDNNRPGTTCADINLATTSGDSRSLHAIIKSSKENTLLLFFDPTCGECEELIKAINANNAIKEAVMAGKLQLLAVSIDPTAVVDTGKKGLDKRWITTRATADLMESTDYILNHVPTLFLIDRNGTVMLKRATIDNITKILQ